MREALAKRSRDPGLTRQVHGRTQLEECVASPLEPVSFLRARAAKSSRGLRGPAQGGFQEALSEWET